MYDNEDCLLIVDMTLKDKRKSHIHHGDTIEENFWQAAKKMGKALTDCRKTKKKKKWKVHSEWQCFAQSTLVTRNQ